MEVNRENLGTEESAQKFVYARNMIDSGRIQEKLEKQDIAYVGDRAYVIQDIEETLSGRLSAQLIPVPLSVINAIFISFS